MVGLLGRLSFGFPRQTSFSKLRKLTFEIWYFSTVPDLKKERRINNALRHGHEKLML